ncbi:SDR family oxidoreductase [Pontibacillus salipaludis]|uniref:SDR family oxidoreductase n=1 Tax=Pontibacillus salipaludis TaxID=1697394 RepID=UPI003570F344
MINMEGDNQLNKVAIITGASRPNGIGAAVCRKLGNDGFDIFFTHLHHYDVKTGYDDRKRDFGERFSEELREKGIRAAHMELDLAREDSATMLLQEVERTLGTPAVLVNNATFCVEVGHNELTYELLNQHCAVNVTGTCMLSAEFAKLLTARHKKGKIINFVSGQDKSPEPGNLAYVATKGAISAFTKSLAMELAGQSITVNALDPGPTDSGMDLKTKDFLRGKFPTGRIGTPEEAANLVAFLASEEANWITGQIIHSDGGFQD